LGAFYLRASLVITVVPAEILILVKCFWHIFSIPNEEMKSVRIKIQSFKAKEVNAVLAYAASLMLTGIPPMVCESAINEVFCSVKKSLSTFIA
jgi:hypothetical protein